MGGWTARAGAATATATGLLLLAATVGPTSTTVDLSPGSGKPGDLVTIGGRFPVVCSFRRDPQTLRVLWDDDAATRTDQPYGTALEVPALTTGQHRVRLACLDAELAEIATATGVVEVLAPARVDLVPPRAWPGADVTARGAGYTAKCLPDGATVRVGDTAVALDSPVTSPGPGEVVVTFTVPDLPPGPVTVELACADGARATTTLDVSPVPTTTTRTATVTPTTPSPSPTPTTSSASPTPSSTVTTGLPRTGFVTSVPPPSQVSWTPRAVLASLALFTVLFWALGFPSEPFNKTLEENRDRIRRWIGRRRDHRPLVPDGWRGLALYTVLAAALLTLVERGTGPDLTSLRQASPLAVGFLVAVPVTTLAYCLPAELHARTVPGAAGVLRFLPGALVFALVCVAVSRWADLRPGYVYGLFAFFAATSAATHAAARDRTTGEGIRRGSLTLLAVSLIAWIAWDPVAAAAQAPGAGFGLLALDAALVATFVLGAQTLVFGLVPLTFLDGLALKRWNRRVWAAIWGASLALLVHVIFSTYVHEVSDPAVAVRSAVGFLVFFAVSAAFWLTFRVSGRHAPGGSPPRLTLVLAVAAVVLLVAVPATYAAAAKLLDDTTTVDPPPPAQPTVTTEPAFGAVVVGMLNVRAGPTTASTIVGTLQPGTPVVLRCTATSGRTPWYRLTDAGPARYVSAVGLRFPDQRRPPPC